MAFNCGFDSLAIEFPSKQRNCPDVSSPRDPFQFHRIHSALAVLLLSDVFAFSAPAAVVAVLNDHWIDKDPAARPSVNHGPIVGHRFVTGVSRSLHIDLDGDGAWEVYLSGDHGNALVADTAAHAEIVGISPRDMGFFDGVIWAYSFFRGYEIGPDLSVVSGSDVTRWYEGDPSIAPLVIWEGFGPSSTPTLFYYNSLAEADRYPFLAVRFQRDDGWHYGWIQISQYTGAQGMVGGWEWETEPDKAIVAGAVPEPGAVALLLGAAAGGMLLSGRRRGR